MLAAQRGRWQLKTRVWKPCYQWMMPNGSRGYVNHLDSNFKET